MRIFNKKKEDSKEKNILTNITNNTTTNIKTKHLTNIKNIIIISIVIFLILIVINKLIDITNNLFNNEVIASDDSTLDIRYGIDSFPDSYKPYLEYLSSIYPDWEFNSLYTNLDWEYVIENENKFGTSLVPLSYSDAWKNTTSRTI